MTERWVLGIGEVLWDCIGDERRPGGAPANVAFHARQLGEAGTLCSAVGHDALGDALLAHLTGHGLDATLVQRTAQWPTGTVTVDNRVPSDPRYTIHAQVAWDHLEFTAPLARGVREAAAICVGSLAQRSPRSRATIQRVLRESAGALVVYDVNLRPPWYDAEVIRATLAHSRILKLNHHEVRTVADLLALGTDTPERVAVALFARFPLDAVCITRGADGVLLITRAEVVDMPGQRIDLVDAVGAGDAFTAALIHGWLADWPPHRTAHFANAVGALVATRPGAMPALRAEFAQLAAASGA